MNDLIQRLQESSEGSRELDSAISEIVRGYPFDTEFRQLYGPAYTTSIDSAMTLVPEGWVITDVIQRRPCAYQWEWAATLGALINGNWRYAKGCSKAAPGTFAIALCIAALKASSHQEETSNEH